MSRTLGIRAMACLALVLAYSHVQAEIVCQGGGKKEIAAACSVRVQRDGYYAIDASAEATADKSSQGELWMDVFVDGAKRGHAETQCGDIGPCRVTVVLQMLLKAGKDYKIETKQGNNRADTNYTRVVVRVGAE